MVNANVNNVDARPANNSVADIKIANIKPAFVKFFVDHFVSPEIHLHVTDIDGFFSGFDGMKYPGIHVMAKPNGILQMIFHVGIFIARARKNLAHRDTINTPMI